MSAALVRHVLRHAPEGATPAERLVLVVLAHLAEVEERPGMPARQCSAPRELLVRQTGLSEAGVRAALRRLAARGFEVRVSTVTDHQGHAVYAHHGCTTRFEVPAFPTDPPAANGTSTREAAQTTQPVTNGAVSTADGPGGHDRAVVPEEWTEAVWRSTLVPSVRMVALAAQKTVRSAGPGAAVDVAALPALASVPDDLCAWALGQLVERGWLRVQLDGPGLGYYLLPRRPGQQHPSEAPVPRPPGAL